MANRIIANLDTSKNNYDEFKCKQNDDLILEANIFENGIDKDITNAIITINCTRADGTFIIQNTDITKNKNKVMVNLKRDFTRIDGLDKLEIVLTENGKQNTTFDFNILVKPSVLKTAVEESKDTVIILEELGNKIVQAGAAKTETERLIATGNAATKQDIATVNTQLEQIAINIKIFGAKGDGVTDDTEAFEKALSINYINLYIPKGIYKITRSLNVFDCIFKGESTRNTILDMSSVKTDYCLKIQGFKTMVSNFTIKANPNCISQFALNIYRLTDGGYVKDIVIDGELDRSTSTNNGVYIENSYYCGIENIRIRHLKQTGVALQIHGGENGGVNSIDFNKLFLGGGLHSVKFTGENYANESLKFTSCTFEGTEKTPIVNESTRTKLVEFDSCYFEGNYVNTTDENVPVLCYNIATFPISFKNCLNRVNNSIKSRYIAKGIVHIENMLNPNFLWLHSDDDFFITNSTIINGIGIGLKGRSYEANKKGSCEILTTPVKELQYYYRKIVDKKTLIQDTNVNLFNIKVPRDSQNLFELKIAFSSTAKSYINGFIKYTISVRNRGSNSGVDLILDSVNLSSFGSVENYIELSSSKLTYNSTTSTYDTQISFKVKHADLVGDITYIVEGFTTNPTDGEQYKMIEYI